MTLSIHSDIIKKTEFLLSSNKIPNIIFHGPHGGGKRTIVNDFVEKIYCTNKELIKAYVMNVNCAHGKGIKFIREELKFFAKTHINVKGKGHFKTIILSNADKLTIDAQSALRRCIELFSHTTRFFIIVENRYKLLRPILSRFCEIFVPLPLIEGKRVNLHTYSTQQCFRPDKTFANRNAWLKKLMKGLEIVNFTDLVEIVTSLYEKGYSGLDIIYYLENTDMNKGEKYHLLLMFHKIKREFRSEKMLLLLMLNFIIFRSGTDLENISFM
jgi:DNA polymerase III delta prime subunit